MPTCHEASHAIEYATPSRTCDKLLRPIRQRHKPGARLRSELSKGNTMWKVRLSVRGYEHPTQCLIHSRVNHIVRHTQATVCAITVTLPWAIMVPIPFHILAATTGNLARVQGESSLTTERVRLPFFAASAR